MKVLKNCSFLLCLIIIHALLTVYIKGILHPVHYAPQSLFSPQLLGQKIPVPYELILVLDSGNLVLFTLIGKHFFKKFALLPSLIYALIPWSSYLTAANSLYIYLLFLILCTLYGLILIESRKIQGSILIISGILLAIYSSIHLLLILPILLSLAIGLKVIRLKDLKFSLAIAMILVIPLLFVISLNRATAKNILVDEIKIFSDPGLLNMVNEFQGAAKQEGFGILAKISENKYIFQTEYLFLKYAKQIIPSSYFTSQEKLLNFSFSPPLYLGLLIPFLYGLYNCLKSRVFRKMLFLATLLVIPSLLSKQTVDLNRLVLFLPVIILLVSDGFLNLLGHRKRILLWITLTLVIFQFLVTLSDLQLREKTRFIKYFGQDYEIKNNE